MFARIGFVALLLAGCGSSARLPMPTPVPQAFPPENVVQLQWQGRNVRLVQVRTSADSVSGVPVGSAAGCAAECRIGFPIAALGGAVRWSKAGSESKTLMSSLVIVPLGLLSLLVLAFAVSSGGYVD